MTTTSYTSGQIPRTGSSSLQPQDRLQSDILGHLLHPISSVSFPHQVPGSESGSLSPPDQNFEILHFGRRLTLV